MNITAVATAIPPIISLEHVDARGPKLHSSMRRQKYHYILKYHRKFKDARL